LDATPEDMLSEWWAQYYASNPTAEVVEDDDFDPQTYAEQIDREAETQAQLAAISDPSAWDDVF
jgi:hypothetical protein